MRKKLIYLVLLGTTTYQGAYQAHGADAALKYLQSSGMQPSLAPRDCGAVCNDTTCAADWTVKNYRCFMGCAQHTGVAKIMSCTNKQFISFINDLHAQLNNLNQQNNAQVQQLKELVAQMADAAATIVAQKAKLGGGRAQNADLQQRFNNLEAKFNADQQRLAGLVALNQQLHDRLVDANANINQRAIDIGGLNAQIVANQGEIAGLKAELDKNQDYLSALIERLQQFIDKVGSVIDMFDKNALTMNVKRKDFEQTIKEFEKLLDSHEKEFIPFVKERENEFNEIINDMRNNIEVSQGFIQRLQALMNETREMYDVASSAYK